MKQNPLNPDLDRKKGTGTKKLIKPETLAAMKKLLNETPTLTAKSLKNKVPALHAVSIRRIQEACQKDLGLPLRKMAKKPLISHRMKAYLRSLVESMPRRLQEVISRDGGNTKY